MSQRPPDSGNAAVRLTIDRLRLRAAGLDEGAARHLARLVGEALAPSLQLPPGSTAIETLRVEVPAQAGESPALLSQRIVDAIGRALARDRAAVGARVLGSEEVAP
ncbi:MAG TPA: hypothetical protein VKW77_01040 [Acidimicrobiales bacterium]|nr:hypothetical protein [Acidimicrobiales bacterium]